MAKKELGENEFDFLVVGSGVSGMAAGMYGARLGMKTLVLGTSHGSEMPVGGVITTTNIVENYPGFIKLTGSELAENIEKHARSYELVSIKEEKVETLKKKGKKFVAKTNKGEYTTKSVLIATGTKWRKLEVPGGAEYENKGVNYCALCDGPLYRGKIVAVVGGSDSAAKDALVLSEHASKVYIIYRGKMIHPEPVNLRRINEKDNIEIINETNVVEVLGEQFVTKVKLDKKYKNSDELELNGVFVAIGHIILSDLAKELEVELNEKGEIVLDHRTSETSVPGVFGAGDVGDKPFKQAITGVAEGCTAAYSAYEYISKNL